MIVFTVSMDSGLHHEWRMKRCVCNRVADRDMTYVCKDCGYWIPVAKEVSA